MTSEHPPAEANIRGRNNSRTLITLAFFGGKSLSLYYLTYIICPAALPSRPRNPQVPFGFRILQAINLASAGPGGSCAGVPMALNYS